MKRRLLKIALFLLLGAIVNVAVAWCSAVWVDAGAFGNWSAITAGGTRFKPRNDEEVLYRNWAVELARSATSFQLTSRWEDPEPTFGWRTYAYPIGDPEVLVPSWAALFCRPSSSPTWDQLHWRRVDARGWPMLALWSGTRFDSSGDLRIPNRTTIKGIRMSPQLTRSGTPTLVRELVLPLGILWPGFAINTLFYAAIMWLLFAAPFALRRSIRRRRRIKRGLCPKCAYPVGISDVCTECGKPLPKRVGTAP